MDAGYAAKIPSLSSLKVEASDGFALFFFFFDVQYVDRSGLPASSNKLLHHNICSQFG